MSSIGTVELFATTAATAVPVVPRMSKLSVVLLKSNVTPPAAPVSPLERRKSPPCTDLNHMEIAKLWVADMLRVAWSEIVIKSSEPSKE